MRWVRPQSVPIGQVWSRFQGRERDGQPAKMYQIRDMEEKHKRQCLNLMLETFLRDEPLCQALGITADCPDAASVATILSNWEALVAQGVSLVCFTEVDGQPGELVGFNVTFVKSIDDEEEDLDKIQGELWKKLLLTLTAAEELVDVFALYGVDRYLSSSGLTVLPQFRGQNIGARLFDARRALCRALGVPATATVFTAATSQALARKCGYSELATLNYSDMTSRGVDLSASTTPTAIVMGTKFN